MSLLDSLPECAHVVGTLPHDGFQRPDEFVPTDEKVEIIDALLDIGVGEIGLSSFTHPKAAPTLRGADEAAARITRRDGVTYRALAPNLRGMERAVEAEVDKVNALVAVSETYTNKNQNRTREEMLAEMDDIIDLAHDHGIGVEARMGTSFYCPYEGAIDPAETLAVADNVVDSGVDEVTLATTMGLANPVEVTERFTAASEVHPGLDMSLHLHGTGGMSLANTLTAMAVGVDRFGASACGLGGGVVLPGDMSGVGNTPTEDLVQMLERMGVGHGVDFGRIEAAAHDVSNRLGLDLTSHVLAGGTVEGVLNTVTADGEAD